MIEHLLKYPPRTQEECCRLAVRCAIAAHGALTDDDLIDNAAVGLARGLFGPAYERASDEQQVKWALMCGQAYRDQLGPEYWLASPALKDTE